MTSKVPGNLEGKLPEPHKNRRQIIHGIALMVIGVLILLMQLDVVGNINLFALLLLPALGLIFLLWGILVRSRGLLIPGGILFGLGSGVTLTESVLRLESENQQAGVILILFAAGWLLITLLSGFFTDKTIWWPLIPGAILGGIGGVLLADVLGDFSRLVGQFWPVLLIAAGLFLIIRRR